jgi:hypothetical protein
MRKIERFIRLDIRFLKRKGWLQPGPSFPLKWKNGFRARCEVGDDFLVLIYERERPSGENQPGYPVLGECGDMKLWVPLTWTPCNYGGRRPWFICPECDRRTGVLYLAGKYFQCRVCHELQYRCQCETPLDRAHRRKRKLKKRLGPDPERKPKGMHQRTFERLRGEVIDAEVRADEITNAAFERYSRRFFKVLRGALLSGRGV